MDVPAGSYVVSVTDARCCCCVYIMHLYWWAKGMIYVYLASPGRQDESAYESNSNHLNVHIMTHDGMMMMMMQGACRRGKSCRWDMALTYSCYCSWNFANLDSAAQQYLRTVTKYHYIHQWNAAKVAPLLK
eukprot:scaffold410052_cov23-Prasinocladus_malaysianus.AAC.1